MIRHVLPEVVLPGISATADGAHVRLDAIVSHNMSLQIGSERVRGTALIALVRFFASMQFHVRLQAYLPSEVCRTERTLYRPMLRIVRDKVTLEISFGLESLAANFALEPILG